jgi:GNAT superfamily N-acetyltransferase
LSAIAVFLGGGLGGMLAVNNYMGKGVHVPDVPEATNRIIVDFSEGLLRKQDVGFVAISSDPTFAPTRGVMATMDAQLRNSDKSHSGARKVPNLPSHFHIKNMDVHQSMRRQGIAQSLLDAIVDYAKTQTDAKALSL